MLGILAVSEVDYTIFWRELSNLPALMIKDPKILYENIKKAFYKIKTSI